MRARIAQYTGNEIKCAERKSDIKTGLTSEEQLMSRVRCWSEQCRLRKVALGYRLPVFVLPCPDYAISRFGAELEAGSRGCVLAVRPLMMINIVG